MKWTGNVARVWRRETDRGFWWGSQKEGFHLEDLRKDWRKFLKWKLNTGALIGQGEGDGGCCKDDTELPVFIKFAEFLD